MLKKKGHMGKTITFKSKEDRELFLSDYNSLSLTEKIFSKWMYQSKYDTKKIKFKENIIKEFLRRGGLRCQILSTSEIFVGDEIKILD